MAFLQCPDAGREAEPTLEAEGSWAGPVTWGCGIRPPPRPPPQGHPEAGLPRRLLASFRRPESWPRPDAGARAAQGGPESGPPAVHLLCLAPEGSAVFSAPWCTLVTALRWDSGRRGSVRPRALLAGTPLCSGAWLAPLPDPPREVALASP